VQTRYKEVAYYFYAFGGPKSPQWRGLIKVVLDMQKSKGGLKWSKLKVVGLLLNQHQIKVIVTLIPMV